jgi:hypothetical protein
VTAILRNNGGRFAWEATLKYFPHQLAEPEQLSEPVEPKDSPIWYTNPESKLNIKKLGTPEFAESLTTFWTEADQRLHETVLKQAKHVSQSTEKRIGELNDGDAPAPFVCDHPSRRKLNTHDPTSSRLFLTHLGFLGIGNRGVFSELGLDHSGSSPEALLKLLDDQCQRQCSRYIEKELANADKSTSSPRCVRIPNPSLSLQLSNSHCLSLCASLSNSLSLSSTLVFILTFTPHSYLLLSIVFILTFTNSILPLFSLSLSSMLFFSHSYVYLPSLALFASFSSSLASLFRH